VVALWLLFQLQAIRAVLKIHGVCFCLCVCVGVCRKVCLGVCACLQQGLANPAVPVVLNPSVPITGSLNHFFHDVHCLVGRPATCLQAFMIVAATAMRGRAGRALQEMSATTCSIRTIKNSQGPGAAGEQPMVMTLPLCQTTLSLKIPTLWNVPVAYSLTMATL
jgi:hypothetical protein